MDRKKSERRDAAKDEMASLMEYRSALHDDYKGVFDRLLGYAKEHAGACARAGNMKLSESMLLAMVLEQQKKIDTLAAERGGPGTRKPPVQEEARSRPQDVDLFALLNRTEVKEYPPWAVC
jgi:hypothetical protein